MSTSHDVAQAVTKSSTDVAQISRVLDLGVDGPPPLATPLEASRCVDG